MPLFALIPETKYRKFCCEIFRFSSGFSFTFIFLLSCIGTFPIYLIFLKKKSAQCRIWQLLKKIGHLIISCLFSIYSLKHTPTTKYWTFRKSGTGKYNIFLNQMKKNGKQEKNTKSVKRFNIWVTKWWKTYLKLGFEKQFFFVKVWIR
jgi:hypothetical protein